MSRIRADKFVNRAATGAPELTYGAQVVTGYGITGAGGINVTGVGTFGKINASEVTSATTFSNTTDSTSSTTGAVIISGGVGIAKSLFVGNNVTIGGTVTYEDVTNVDSVGLITAQTGVKVTAGGIDVTAGGLKITAGVTTFSNEVTAAGGVDINGGLDVAGISTLANTVTVSAGGLKVGSGVTVDATTGISTFSAAVYFNDALSEQCVIVANKLSAATNIDLEQGNVWYFSTNETGTATPNVRWNGSVALDDRLKVGETVNVTIIAKPNGAGYYAALNVDGSGVTEEWLGGSAPGSANAGGYDILTHTLFKVGNASFLCFSNVQNYA